ncbi:MAG TPA: hypothetical protein VNS79_15890, partial [Sphingobium sp.]|nr:hypothetical protein [Sphingobium sp.]
FFDKLADRIGETGTYGDLAKRRVKLGDIMAAARDSAGDPRTERVLGLLAGQVGKNPEIPLSGLFGLGLLEDMPIGGRDGQPALRAGMNAYQLWAFAVQGQPGSLNLSKPVDLLIPGSVVRLTGMANGPAARPRFSFGPAGETSVNTSTLRLQLEIGLGLLRLIGALVDVRVPILIDIGAGGADLQKISCADTDEQARDTEVTLHGYSGLVNAYIGTPPNNAMVSPMPALSEGQIGQVRLVNVLGLITVDARAVASPVLGRSEDVSFGPDGPGRVGTPASPGAPVTIGNNAAAGPLLNSLIDSLSGADGLQVKLLGLCLPLICSENIAIVRQTLLGGLVAPIAGLVGNTADPLLDNLLAALGIQLGHTSLWVTGARCGVPVLI